MDTLTGSTICSPQQDSAYWTWVGLLTDVGLVQLLIRNQDVEASGGIPPTAKLEVKGDWLRVCEGNKPWFFVVNRLEIMERPGCGPHDARTRER